MPWVRVNGSLICPGVDGFRKSSKSAARTVQDQLVKLRTGDTGFAATAVSAEHWRHFAGVTAPAHSISKKVFQGRISILSSVTRARATRETRMHRL